MNRFHKFIACAGLAVVVCGIVLAVNPHCARGAEMLTCHGVYGSPSPSHQLATDAAVGLGALIFGVVLLLLP